MRIIAGTHRGRPLISPRGDATRPITDRVKQSLFDKLASAGALESAVVLDVFAGTGSMGIECLSRGAAHATFVEKHPDALERLRENIALLRETERSRIIEGNALSTSLADALPRKDYTLLFIDPPYAMVTDEPKAQRLWKVLEKLRESCAPDAKLILRLEAHRPAPALAGWGGPDSAGYGSMALHLFHAAD